MATNQNYTNRQVKLARFAKALGHPVRIQILEILANSSCCYSGDMVAELPIARSTLSQHLKELKDSGLIQGETDPPRIKYCINQESWQLAQNYFAEFFKKKL